MKNWYTITAKGETTAEVAILGPIGNSWDGEGVTARQFIEDFRAITQQNVTLSVNSPGGSLFDGITMYTAMAGSGKNITAKVMGIAASAASIVLMAAKKITMPKNTHMMVHKAGWIAMGNADEMRATADVLDGLDASIIATYAARTGKPETEIKALLDTGDVWMSADEAVAAGFADEATELVRVTAAFDIASLPPQARAAFEAAADVTQPAALADQISAAATAAGFGEHAAVFALCPTLADAQARINDAREIVALCQVLKVQDKAAGYIAAGKTCADVRNAIATERAALDEQTHTSNVQRTSAATDTGQPAALKTADVWAARRKQLSHQ